MDSGETVIRRMVADLESGRARWVPRRDDPHESGPKTDEARRTYDRERKARQRAESRGDHA